MKKAKQAKQANPVGRPPLFKTAEEMQAKITEYFDYCDNRKQQVYAAKQEAVIEILNPAPYGVEGLAAFLDTTRETLRQYEKEPEFSYTLKKCKQKIAADVENRLMDGKNAAGPIFNLKNNFGWKDEQKIEITEGRSLVEMLREEQNKNDDE